MNNNERERALNANYKSENGLTILAPGGGGKEMTILAAGDGEGGTLERTKRRRSGCDSDCSIAFVRGVFTRRFPRFFRSSRSPLALTLENESDERRREERRRVALLLGLEARFTGDLSALSAKP